MKNFMMYAGIVAVAAVLVHLLLGGTDDASITEAETSAEPLRFAVTDIEGLEQLQLDFGPFKESLEEVTGRTFEFYPVSSRTAVVEALKSGEVDVVLSGPAEYVVINTLTGATPIVGLERQGYTSAIITTTSTGVETLADLKGKKVAFEDPGSTSRHLAPMQMLADSGVNPLEDIDYTHTDKAIMHEALKNGDIDAMAQSYEGWVSGLLEEEPEDVQSTFTVVAQSDPLPNDLIVVGAHVPEVDKALITDAFTNRATDIETALSSTDENDKYIDVRFVTDVSDTDYDQVRQMYVTAGYPEFGSFIE